MNLITISAIDNNKNNEAMQSHDIQFTVDDKAIDGVIDCDIHTLEPGETVKATITCYIRIK